MALAQILQQNWCFFLNTAGKIEFQKLNKIHNQKQTSCINVTPTQSPLPNWPCVSVLMALNSSFLWSVQFRLALFGFWKLEIVNIGINFGFEIQHFYYKISNHSMTLVLNLEPIPYFGKLRSLIFNFKSKVVSNEVIRSSL